MDCLSSTSENPDDLQVGERPNPYNVDGSRRFFTTGQAAARLGVQPDTVLKWIRKGWLRSWKTAGGHNRVEASELERLFIARHRAAPPQGAAQVPCWEYFARGGALREECAHCVTYQVLAARCYELRRLQADLGIQCPGPCETCAYFRRTHNLPQRVLIVTPELEWTQELVDRSEQAELIIRVAPDIYMASALVGTFLPGAVVVDDRLSGKDCGHLIASLQQDPRIPRARVLIASAGNGDVPPGASGILTRPFGIDELSAAI